ncbi:Flp family type IVb pilin [Tissierella creatinini]|nr:Flp family type IVb pilin [Tissierella creatinini]TJX61507.1 Flp family type IVb pilin [Soehngenia saccharolytica]
MKALKKLIIDENGQGLVEYGLIIISIAIVVVVSVRLFGQSLDAYYHDEIINKLP